MKPIKNSGIKNVGYPLALVSGAAHRLGKSFALHLARLGFAIILHYYSSGDKVLQTMGEISEFHVPVFPIRADLRDTQEIEALFDEVDTLLLQPDLKLTNLKVLVNSAAIMQKKDAQTITMEEFEETIRLNLQAPFMCSQLAYKRMPLGGLIVNISDVAAHKSWVGYPAYTVSKAGLESLTKVLARSFAPTVRVNAIAPGLALASDNILPEDWQRLVARLPAKRTVEPGELDSALEFLIKNEYITGQTIVVDGGYSLL